MLSRGFLDSALDSGMWVVGGGLLVVIAGVTIALGPTAIARWF